MTPSGGLRAPDTISRVAPQAVLRRAASGAARAVLAAALASGLTGCIIPTDGPLERQVFGEAGFVAASTYEMTYGLVDLDAITVKSLDDFDYTPFRDTFGLGSAAAGIRIGVGDTVDVTIFEAGPDGLFSTTERKQVSLPLTVQGDGRISVPYAGSVQAAGRTPEQIRSSILAVLRERAVEPDVIVNLNETVSRTVTVVSDIGASGVVPLVAGDERVLDVIARAGGLATPPYETFVTLQRDGRSCTVLVQTLIDRPRENIFVRPGDTIILSNDPRSFAAFGAVEAKGNYELESAEVSLAEAAAQARGLNALRANPQGYFIFRYEREHVIEAIAEQLAHAGDPIEAEPLHALLADPHVRDEQGRLPIVYRIDLRDPDSFFIAQRFAMRDKDVIYLARSLTGDITEFTTLLTNVSSSVAIVRNAPRVIAGRSLAD